MQKTLEYYADAFSRLHVGVAGDHQRPHKPALLLAIISLIESGKAKGNRFAYEPSLLELFRRYFEVVREGNDRPYCMNPFWRLRQEGFFRHEPRPGREAEVRVRTSAPTLAELQEMTEFSRLDDELFALLQNPANRRELRELLIRKYFPEHTDELRKLAEEEPAVAGYEDYLQGRVADAPKGKPEPDVSESVRDAAFARIVREAYDYQCAACGLRVLVDCLALVEAAHIIPVSISRDNDPRNGMALCKNHHWAMDSNLLVPCPDMKWHVSPVLDKRVSGHAALMEYSGRELLLPRQRKYHPKAEALSWRERQLKETG